MTDYLIKRFLFVLYVFLILCPFYVQARPIGKIEIGPRFQKTPNLYWENGFCIDYTNEKLWSERLFIGFSYITSRFGSAIHSNALKQDNFLFSAKSILRKGCLIRPSGKLNLGYFYADYEADIFDDLPNSSLILSIEAGLAIDPRLPVRADLSLGYNLLTGNGLKGPGTLYPLFYQLTIFWDVLGGSKK